MSPSQSSDLTREPVPLLIRRLAIPASVGYFFNTMFNVVDTFFAGMVSTQALAALSLSFPVFFIIIAIGGGISTGATALIGTALGAGHRREAGRLAAQSLSFGIVAGIVVAIAGLMAAPYLYSALGAKGDYLRLCLRYMTPIFCAAILFVTNYMFNGILSAQGQTKPHRNYLMFAFLLNIGLDPWFIYGGLGLPAMGVRGLALATVVAQVLGIFYLGRKVRQSGIARCLTWRDFLPRADHFGQIARQGLPAAMNYMTIALGSFVITYYFSLFGREAVAAYGIATRIEQLVLLPTIGLNVATLAIVAQSHGAGALQRIPEAVGVSLKYGAYVMGLGITLVFVLARWLMGLFTSDPAVIQVGVDYLSVAVFILYAYVLLLVSIAALQGVKRPMFALWIGLARQVAAPLMVFQGLIVWAGLGLNALYWGLFGIVWGAALVAAWYSRRGVKKAMAEAAAEQRPVPEAS